MARKKKYRLSVTKLGPIVQADIEFGDLTVLVGAQATGKSVFLQTLKLVLDQNHIHDTFADNSMGFNGDPGAFLGGYYGKGMSALWKAGSSIRWCDKAVELPELARSTKSQQRAERMFYIPAQRVVSLPGGKTQNFGSFAYGDPYVLRRFSDTVHHLLQNEFGAKGDLFPQSNRLNETLRKPISEHLMGGATLETDAREFTKTLVLRPPGSKEGLPYLAWSAGQREFMPLLLGLYWLCPAGATPRRGGIEWVVIEEPEMGLHPLGISTLLMLVLELMRRGYRVVISTHSPVVLDMVWAIQQFKQLGGDESDVRRLFGLAATPQAKDMAKQAIGKDYRVYFFDRKDGARDISSLDPAAEGVDEAEWGGLVGFASRASEAIAHAASRAAIAKAKKAKPSRGAKA
jgi:hypothetical protein